MPPSPTAIHLKRTQALLITWDDGLVSSFPLRTLRKNCPCAGCQGERDILGRTLMPIVKTTYDGPITATGAALVGNYALRIDWADGHSAGIYSFAFLRELDALTREDQQSSPQGMTAGTDLKA